VDSHRSYPPDEHDGRWSPGERGFPDPEWDRRGGDPRYQPAPGDASYGDASYGDASYGASQPPAYGEPQAPVYNAPAGYNGGEPQGYPGGDPQGYPGGDPQGYPGGDPQGYPGGGPRYTDSPGYGAGYQPEGYGDTAQATGLLGTVGPRSGETLPPMPAAPGLPGAVEPSSAPPDPSRDGQGESQTVRHSTEPIDRAALRRPAGGPGQLGDGVYKSRRPGTAAALGVVTVLMEVVALRLLFYALFTQTSVGGAIASSFVVLGLPMFALGLYGLLSGNAATPGAGGRVWLRPPLVYLPVALTLFLAAGLSASG